MGGVVDVANAAHVPFAEVGGGVAGVLERAGERGDRGVEEVANAVFAIALAGVDVGIDQMPDGHCPVVMPTREGEQTGEAT